MNDQAGSPGKTKKAQLVNHEVCDDGGILVEVEIPADLPPEVRRWLKSQGVDMPKKSTASSSAAASGSTTPKAKEATPGDWRCGFVPVYHIVVFLRQEKVGQPCPALR